MRRFFCLIAILFSVSFLCFDALVAQAEDPRPDRSVISKPVDKSNRVRKSDSTEAEAVRINNLANLEALLNIIANGGEILGIQAGGSLLFSGIALLFLRDRRKLGVIFIPTGIIVVIGAIALPGVINLLVQTVIRSD